MLRIQYASGVTEIQNAWPWRLAIALAALAAGAALLVGCGGQAAQTATVDQVSVDGRAAAQYAGFMTSALMALEDMDICIEGSSGFASPDAAAHCLQSDLADTEAALNSAGRIRLGGNRFRLQQSALVEGGLACNRIARPAVVDLQSGDVASANAVLLSLNSCIGDLKRRVAELGTR